MGPHSGPQDADPGPCGTILSFGIQCVFIECALASTDRDVQAMAWTKQGEGPDEEVAQMVRCHAG